MSNSVIIRPESPFTVNWGTRLEEDGNLSQRTQMIELSFCEKIQLVCQLGTNRKQKTSTSTSCCNEQLNGIRILHQGCLDNEV